MLTMYRWTGRTERQKGNNRIDLIKPTAEDVSYVGSRRAAQDKSRTPSCFFSRVLRVARMVTPVASAYRTPHHIYTPGTSASTSVAVAVALTDADLRVSPHSSGEYPTCER